MKIIKQNFYDIVRLYINQLGITIFSMLLYTAVGAIEDKLLSTVLSIVVSVFSIGFYLTLIYFVMWELGSKDKIKIDGGRMEPSPFKGLIMGVVANIPNFIISSLTLVFSVICMATSSEVIKSVFAVLNLITRFHESMYMGIIIEMIPGSGYDGMTEYFIESILFLVLPIISFIVTHMAYRLGNNDKKIFAFIKRKK